MTIPALRGWGMYDTSVLPSLGMEITELCGGWRTARRRRLHDKMSTEEFRRLTKLLGAAEFREPAEFRSLSGDHGGLTGQEAESFAAEIPSGDRWHEDGPSPG